MSQRFVLFADMLGFAPLVMKNAESVHLLSPRLGTPSKEEREAVKAGDRLVLHFRGFHEAVSDQIKEHLRRDSKAIIFSDSVFLTLYRLPDIMAFARGLMWRLLTNRIPSRIAVAQGSFSTLRYASDIAGEAAVYSTQFLGTGVVRAYQAERAIKGIAISIDESVRPFADELAAGEVLPLPAQQGSVYAIGNLLFDETDNTSEARKKRLRTARRALHAMRTASDQNFHGYYDFALNALDQMRGFGVGGDIRIRRPRGSG
ncbi:MAG: hypothetical protein HYY76_08765 [Acidobacteria bacterium]|nr:hypothetical protein [Acidobacteriota bacterium]